MAQPLDDVRIIEVDSWMAAPSAAAILADLGAEVIKVEPLEGDPMRNNQRPPKLPDELKGFDYQFDVDNRGKKSVAIDLTHPRGPDVVHRLCRGAQVFVCNLLPPRQRRFGLDPASLHDVNPSLVHATLTGYGTTGPQADRPGYDVTAFFARSGLYDSMREGPDGVVPMARPAQGDHTAGLALVGAILGALRLAERTGEGQIVETSLYETAVWTQATDYAITVMDRAPVRPRAREHQIQATRNRYRCGDGRWVVFNMPNESAWPTFCKALGCEDVLDDERFVDLRARFRHMPELVARIDDALAVRSRDEWGEIFDANGFIWAPVLGLEEVVDDAQAEAVGLFPVLESPEIGSYRTVAHPLKFATADVDPKAPAPRLAEHSRPVLLDSGLTDAELTELAGDGVIGLGEL